MRCPTLGSFWVVIYWPRLQLELRPHVCMTSACFLLFNIKPSKCFMSERLSYDVTSGPSHPTLQRNHHSRRLYVLSSSHSMSAFTCAVYSKRLHEEPLDGWRQLALNQSSVKKKPHILHTSHNESVSSYKGYICNCKCFHDGLLSFNTHHQLSVEHIYSREIL